MIVLIFNEEVLEPYGPIRFGDIERLSGEARIFLLLRKRELYESLIGKLPSGAIVVDCSNTSKTFAFKYICSVIKYEIHNPSMVLYITHGDDMDMISRNFNITCVDYRRFKLWT